MSENMKRVSIAIAALILGMFAFWAFDQREENGDDENRPPIIVKNGSIDFETTQTTPPWKAAAQNGSWRLDHPKGKSVSTFIVELVDGTVSGGGACPKMSFTASVTIAGGGETFTIGTAPREKPGGGGHTGPPEMAITGAKLSRKSDQVLQFAGDHVIEKVTFTTAPTPLTTTPAVVECLGPTRVGIVQF